VDVVYAIQSIATPTLDSLMTLITDLGSEEAYIVMVIVAYLGVDARFGQKLGIVLVASFFLNQYAKGWFDTPRPFALDADVVRTQRALDGAGGAGFPSGHAQSSATFWLYAATQARRRWFWALAVLLVAVVSFSRLYLGVHVPADIAGGLVIGVALVLLAVALERRRPRLATGTLVAGALVVPFTLHLVAPTPESDLLAGALGALVLGPTLVPHRTDGPVWGRALVALIGVLLAFAVLFATSAYLPEHLKRDPVAGYLRYLTLGLAAFLLAPWLGRVFALVPRPPRRGGATGRFAPR
jgi:membrane-associated phospholipid phosphatase